MLYLIRLKHFISILQEKFPFLRNYFFNTENNLNFRTMKDMSYLIRNNVKFLPSDIDLIVGIPRSGIIPAYLIGLFLNKNVCSLNEFLNNIFPSHGDRFLEQFKQKDKLKILVVDDSISTGNAMNRVKTKLKQYDSSKYEFIFCTVFATKQCKNMVNFYFEIVEQPRMFQWNYLNHITASQSCWDLDGVLCTDPTSEQNDDGEKYINFISNAKPLFIPGYTIHSIVTARLEKYRELTEKWLDKHNVKYKHLYMLNLPDMQKRRKLGCHGKYKAEIYKNLTECNYFIESEHGQAVQIANISKKPVICVETDELIKPS